MKSVVSAASGNKHLTLFGFFAITASMVMTVYAVSYTHLDVYKRQAHGSPRTKLTDKAGGSHARAGRRIRHLEHHR